MSQRLTAKGYVRAGDVGVPNVTVSNQEMVVQTDENGYFTLPIEENTTLFICKPDGYDLPLNAYNQPQFFYHYYPNGGAKNLNLRYKGMEPTGELPELIYFSLIPTDKKTSFSMLAMGDIQPKTEEDISFFRDLIVPELMAHGRNTDFLVPMGDLTWDDLSFYPLLRDHLCSIGLPYYAVCGNHDINLRTTDKAFKDISFKTFFGPSYYSFDQGQVHFMVLNDIGYEGWDESLNSPGETCGWLDERQLSWIENDLATVPDDHLVVIISHIPIYTHILPEDDYRNILNRDQLFDMLASRKHLLSLAAHTHFVEQVDLKNGGWKGDAEFPLLIAGAACGAWWKGPRDYHGLPVRMGMDGTPNGFFKFHFDGNQFDFEFIPAGMPSHHQIGVRFPEREVKDADFQEKLICANIYAASAKCKVSYKIDNGDWKPMVQTIEEDPYVQDFMAAHREDYPLWMKVRKTTHLWKAKEKEQIDLGIHTIEIKAIEPSNKELWIKKSFQVVKEKEEISFRLEEQMITIF